MKKQISVICLLALLLGAANSAGAAEVEVDVPQPPPRRGGYYPAPPPPRGYIPPPAYYPAPPPRVRLGDICEVLDSRSGRTCDLRRPLPVNSYCECISPSGRAREGRVVR